MDFVRFSNKKPEHFRRAPAKAWRRFRLVAAGGGEIAAGGGGGEEKPHFVAAAHHSVVRVLGT